MAGGALRSTWTCPAASPRPPPAALLAAASSLGRWHTHHAPTPPAPARPQYVVVLHLSTQRLLPRLPHLLVRLLSSSEVDSRPLHLAPRQLWLICSTLVVLIRCACADGAH